jgi:hypothetical protein
VAFVDLVASKDRAEHWHSSRAYLLAPDSERDRVVAVVDTFLIDLHIAKEVDIDRACVQFVSVYLENYR